MHIPLFDLHQTHYCSDLIDLHDEHDRQHLCYSIAAQGGTHWDTSEAALHPSLQTSFINV